MTDPWKVPPDGPADYSFRAEGTVWGKSSACLRCGAVVAGCMDTSERALGRGTATGRDRHTAWHADADWTALLGVRRALYEQAGIGPHEAVAAELGNERPSVDALRAMGGLRRAG